MIELSDITDSILDAVGILVDDAISGLQFNKTIRGKIAEVVDASIGRYKIQYQNSYFTAYSADSNATYTKGSEVYVEILSNDFEKNAIILGTVRRLGSNYISIIEKLDKYTEIGPEQSVNNSEIQFCSYSGNQTQTVSITNLSANAMMEAASASDTLKVAMKIKTVLPSEQRAGGGNYGLKIVAEYFDAAYVTQSTAHMLDREYLFDINDMTGQPYKYTSTVDQYTLFSIDAKNFRKIKSITAFCNGFPVTKTQQPKDIFLSDIKFQFLKALTEEELSSSSLKITTPLGSYFTQNNADSKTLKLKADLKIKGKAVNYDYQQVDFYWFRHNPEVTALDPRFSSYGGNGWECLNKANSSGGFLADTYEHDIRKDLCLTKETQFKCVAVFIDGGQSVSLSDIIVIKNKTDNIVALSLSSSAGTTFAFNTGYTVLTLQGYTPTNATTYCWIESINGGTPVVLNETSNTLNVNIATPAATLLTYECGVYENGVYQGTASINLTNSNESLGYTLVIKDGQQIFKYDTYGTSPASHSKAAADRMTIPVLSFEIYDKQGNLIDIPDADKVSKIKSFRWIWPTSTDGPWADSKTKKQTMLETSNTLTQITIADLANNRTVQKYALVNQPTFAYSIIDKYNPEYANTADAYNQIKLEVEYPEGNFLTAFTNFSFTKEGELGTNGTQYVAQIELKSPYKELFICGKDKKLYAVSSNNTSNFINIDGTNNNNKLSNLFKVHLWDGATDVITSASYQWSLSNSTKRSNNTSWLTISENNVTINTNGTSYSNILQVTITYDGLKFYATYPILFVSEIFTRADGSYNIFYIDKGYREVMYESDGTRGKFKGLPFVTTYLSPAGKADIDDPARSVSDLNTSWNGPITAVTNSLNQFTIEPPAYYIAEDTGHYISVKGAPASVGHNVYTYLPIELYLNRYGMSAMNEWDGNSIQIDKDGNSYILAPQIGAGRKENDNSFTGITMGEVFQDVNNKEIGMFGYYKGARSLFLDAETGDAEFGLTGKGQIKIHASDGEGTIDSGDYSTSGNGSGLKIKFTSTGSGNEHGPYIKYGSDNFTVNSSGHLTAKGGGSIAGWNIDNNNLYSSNGLLYLNSSTPKIYGQENSTNKHDTLTSTNSGFYLASDGLSIGSKFKIEPSGTVQVGNGAVSDSSDVRYWTIDADGSQSYIKYGTRGSDGSVYISTNQINLGSKFYVSHNGVMRIGTGAVTQASGSKYWTINGTDSRSYISYNNTEYVPSITGPNTNLRGSDDSVYLGTDGIRLGNAFGVDKDGNMKATSGYISSFAIRVSDDKGYLYSTNNRLVLSNEGYLLGPTLRYLGHLDTAPVTKTISGTAYLNGDHVFYNDFNNIRYTTIPFNADNGYEVSYNNWYFKYNNNYYKITSTQIGTNNKGEPLYRHQYTASSSTALNNVSFSPNHRKWEITQDGIAYFTDVKIKNTPNKSNNDQKNTFEWTNSNGQNIFSLTDSGSNIGGWSINGNTLSSTGGGVNVTLNSANAGTESSVLSVGNVFQLYGNGQLNTTNINASGGSIGGCTISGGGISGSGFYLGGSSGTYIEVGSLKDSQGTLGSGVVWTTGSFLTDITIPGFSSESIYTDFECTGINLTADLNTGAVTGTISIGGKRTSMKTVVTGWNTSGGVTGPTSKKSSSFTYLGTTYTSS